MLRGTIGFSPVFALLVASQPSVADAATLAPSSVFSVCSGVSLPPSVVTNILKPVLTGVVTPLQTSVNSLVGGLFGTPANVDLTGLLATAVNGTPITLQAVSNAALIGPASDCYTQATGFTLAAPAGIAIGGNQITGLGNNNLAGTATASAGDLNAIAFGNGARTAADAAGAIALGTGSVVGPAAAGGVAIGSNANVSAINGLALGSNAGVSAINSVALGTGSTATRGATTAYLGYGLSAPQNSAGEVSIGTVGAERQLTNVAAGATATDAVNVAQLTAVGGQVTANADAIGTLSGLAVRYTDTGHTAVTLGGAASPPVTLGNLAAGTLSASSTAAVNGSQLFATNAIVDANTNALGTLSDLAVEYTDAGRTAVSLGATGSAPVGLGNLAAGTLSATSTAAVNGSQLFATNAIVDANANALGTLSDLAVEYTDTNHTAVSLGATGSAPVGLGNLAAGTLSATSTAAVNGSQLFATNAIVDANTNAIGTLSDLAVEYTDAGRTAVSLGATGSAPVGLGNLAAGTLSATSTAAVNGGQLFATNAKVTTNTTDIGALTTSVGANTTLLQQQGGAIGVNADAIVALRRDTTNGAIGPVQYSDPATPTMPNQGIPTNDLTLVGRDPVPVRLHNVADGSVAAGSTDGVNGGQLFALGNQIGSLADLAVEYDDVARTGVTLGDGTTPVTVRNVAAGSVSATSSDAVNGSQLFALDGQIGSISALGVQYDTADHASVTFGGVNAAPVALHNVAAGAVAQGSSDAVNGGQLFALSTSVGALSDLAVQYDDASKTSVTLFNPAGTPVTLSGIAPGALSASSTDAVNGAQLFATNQSITDLSTTVSNQGDAFVTLNTAVTNGGIGPVRYADAGDPTTSNGGVPSQDLTLVGANPGAVALHNLAAGSLFAGSTDAVNGGQLGALGVATASVFGAGYTYNPTTNSYSGGFSYGGTSYSNLQSVLGAIQTSVASGGGTLGDDGIKYFHTTSDMADSSATGTDSTAIGPTSVSSGEGSIAVGRNAAAMGDSSVAIGDGAMAQDGEAVSIGQGNLASGNGAVSIGDPNVAIGDGATALGKDNTATGDGAIALGNTNSATGLGAAAIGYTNIANGEGAAAIGFQNKANGDGAIAIGSDNVATGDQSLAIGTNVQTTANDTLAIGSFAASSGTSSVTVGNRTNASGASAIAAGNDAAASGMQSSAFGNRAAARGGFSLAEGAMATASGFASTALGAGASTTAFGSTAVGTGSIASFNNSVALGAATQTVRGAVADYTAFGLDADQASAGEVAIASNLVYTDPMTGLPTPTGARQITGVAAGNADTDAVNVSQLRGVSANIGSIVAAGLGGGSSYNPTTGQLIAPSYTLGGVTYGNVGDALQALASTGTGGTGSTGGSVTYTDNSHTTVTLGAGGTTIQNVAAGAVTPTSTEAVNGAQLAATNTAVSTLATQVDNGAVGVVRYSNGATPTTANGGTQTNDATLVGQNAAAPVALHNVAAGSAVAGSTDAVNGDQLAGTNRAVVTAQTTANTALAMSSSSVQYDTAADNAVTLGNGGSGAVTVHNVAPGLTTTDAANVGQVAAAMTGAVSQSNTYTDGRIAALSFDLKKVQRDANAGAAGAMALAGMPQPYEAGKGMIAMGAGTFQGQTAIALGVAKALSDGHTVIKLGATYNSRGMVGANGGVGWQF